MKEENVHLIGAASAMLTVRSKEKKLHLNERRFTVN
jgi:hypothetical protein